MYFYIMYSMLYIAWGECPTPQGSIGGILQGKMPPPPPFSRFFSKTVEVSSLKFFAEHITIRFMQIEVHDISVNYSFTATYRLIN